MFPRLETGFESERDVLLLIMQFDFTGGVLIQSLLGYNSFVHWVFECPRPVQIGPCALERKQILNKIAATSARVAKRFLFLYKLRCIVNC